MSAPHVPLAEQISALRETIDRRSNFLADQVARGRIKQAAAERELDRLEAAWRTLGFVRRHYDDFHAWFAAKRRFEAERAAELAAAENGEAAAS